MTMVRKSVRSEAKMDVAMKLKFDVHWNKKRKQKLEKVSGSIFL